MDTLDERKLFTNGEELQALLFLQKYDSRSFRKKVRKLRRTKTGYKDKNPIKLFLFQWVLFSMDGQEAVKYMKYSKSLLLMMIILPWFTVPFLGKDTFKRYLPAGLFISLVVQIVHSIAKQRRWWWWHEPSGGLAFIGGPYFVGTLWILKWTYGKFIRYMALNLAVHSMFTYVLVDWLRKARIVSLVRLQKIHLLLIFLLDALLLYGFQVLKEQIEMNEECSRIE